jgi:hypothetical protein
MIALEPPRGMVPVHDIWTEDKEADIRIEGGRSLRTFKLSVEDERVQYIIRAPTDRPIKAKVELWIGPQRCVHTLKFDCQNGYLYPVRGTIKFKKGVEPVLKISTDGGYDFPLVCGVFVPNREESNMIGGLTEDMFYSAPMKERVQGGSIIHGNAKGGAVRNFIVPNTWKKTQLMFWSKDVGKKSLKSDVEFLQGPNEAKQTMFVQCGGSTQPYHMVLDTEGGGVIRCNSKKFMEDGLFEIAVAPYEIGEPPH